MVRLLVLSLCALSVVSLAACGTSADREAARTAAQALYTAARDHRGDEACVQMSPDLRAAIVADHHAPCADAVLRLDLKGRTPAAVRVYADAAEVRFDHGDTLFLGDTRQGWRVQALGCRPQGAGPYDCEAQA